MKRFLLGGLFLLLLFILVYPVNAGGVAVPINNIDLSNELSNYDMKPGRLKFEFEGSLHAIQLRKVKQDYISFLVMDLDEDKPEDITAYKIEDSFNLTSGEVKRIDLDKNGIADILIEFGEIGTIDKIRSASFSIKKIDKNYEEKVNNINDSIGSDNSELINSNLLNAEETQEPILESVIVLSKESKENLNLFDRTFKFIKNLFK